MRILPAFALAAVLSVCGCAAHATKPVVKEAPKPIAEAAPANYTPPCGRPPATPEARYDCDRKSILAMAGEFRVRFAFDEVAALAPGYAPHAAQRTGGTELVEVIADRGDFISLQHILVVGKDHTVIKHWRQDWQYQPKSLLSFRGLGRYETQPVAAADAAGAWSQTVFEVDDAPRYSGLGRWVHANGEDSWESGRVWRPLPRREYTKRADYQALEVVNRHALTPAGWVHEQDNTKLALKPDGSVQALARERGINSYTRITDYDFGAGREYWQKTSAFWAGVRDEWARYEAAHPSFTTSPEPNGEPRIEKFFDLAERAEKGEAVPATDVRAVFDEYMRSSAPGLASRDP